MLKHNSKIKENEPQWSEVDKTKLPRIAFADMGEEDKKSTWKYPHHWVENGKLNDEGIYESGDMYLHKGGLIAAWQAANGARSGQEASSSVKAHLLAHRKAIGLEEDNDSKFLNNGIFKNYTIDDQEINENENSIIHYITTEDIDWASDIVIAKGMDAKNYEKFRSVFYNHDTYLPIGSNLWLKVIENRGVMAKTKFSSKNQFSQDIYNLYKEGIINTWSIRLRPKNTSIEIQNINGEEVTVYKEWELIEYSAAPLAANPNTITLAKSLVKSRELKLELDYYDKLFKLEEMIREQDTKLKNIYEKTLELEKSKDKIEIIEGDLKSLIKSIKRKNESETSDNNLAKFILEIAKNYRRS